MSWSLSSGRIPSSFRSMSNGTQKTRKQRGLIHFYQDSPFPVTDFFNSAQIQIFDLNEITNIKTYFYHIWFYINCKFQKCFILLHFDESIEKFLFPFPFTFSLFFVHHWFSIEQEIWLSLSSECCNACIVKVRPGQTEVSIADTNYFNYTVRGGSVEFGRGRLTICQMDLREINDDEKQPEFFRKKA